jgi:ABC-type glycerol-3-phosphate transport system permease component
LSAAAATGGFAAAAPARRSSAFEAALEQAQSTQRSELGAKLVRVLVLTLLVVAALVFIFPFVWSGLTSFKSQQEAVGFTLLPESWTLEGYKTAFGSFPFGSYFLHSMGLALAVTLSNVVLCALGGYAFARMRFPGNNVLFAIVLGSMMIPDQVRMVPVFSIIASLGLINSFAGVWLLQCVQPMGMFLMRQHFLAMPKELEESARLDGASYFMTFRRVMLPLAGPAIATNAILTFQGAWNEFFWPLLILQRPEHYTLPLGLARFTSAYETQWPPLMAATVIATAPVLIIYVCSQRWFNGDATAGAVKG